MAWSQSLFNAVSLELSEYEILLQSLASPAPGLRRGHKGKFSRICLQVIIVTLHTGDLNYGQEISWRDVLWLILGPCC